MKTFSALLVCFTFGIHLQAAAQLPVTLGTTVNFSVLAGSTVTSIGPTIVNGGLGLSPGTSVTGFPPGQVTGAVHVADATAVTAQNDLTTAYNDAMGRLLPTAVSGDIGGQTLTPGLYQATSTLGITGTVTLNGQGNPNSVFIFQVGTGLTTATNSQVLLIGGAQAANIFWQVGSSATLGTYSVFNGTILAQASITVTTGAALNGRALARTGAVTLDSNTVVNPGPPTTGTPGPLTITCPSSFAQLSVTYNSLIGAAGGTPAYTFSATVLPPGLGVNAASGAVTGTPTTIGTTAFVAKVQDSASGSVTANCSITVGTGLPGTPAPPSLILILTGFACIALYAVIMLRRSAPLSSRP